METDTIILFSVLGFLALVTILAHIEDIVATFSPSFREGLDYDRFMKNTRERGLDYVEAMDEWDVRALFVQVREEASLAVEADVENWLAHMEAALMAAIERLKKKGRKDMIPALIGMYKGLPYNHVLYERATAMVSEHMRARVAGAVPISWHHAAALRIVRPS